MSWPTDSGNEGYVIGVDIGTSLVEAAVYSSHRPRRTRVDRIPVPNLPAIPAAHPEATVSPNVANKDTYRQLHYGFVSCADRLAEGYSQMNNTFNRSQ